MQPSQWHKDCASGRGDIYWTRRQRLHIQLHHTASIFEVPNSPSNISRKWQLTLAKFGLFFLFSLKISWENKPWTKEGELLWQLLWAQAMASQWAREGQGLAKCMAWVAILLRLHLTTLKWQEYNSNLQSRIFTDHTVWNNAYFKFSSLKKSRKWAQDSPCLLLTLLPP